jgi:hypothetical protein
MLPRAHVNKRQVDVPWIDVTGESSVVGHRRPNSTDLPFSWSRAQPAITDGTLVSVFAARPRHPSSPGAGTVLGTAGTTGSALHHLQEQVVLPARMRPDAR